MLDTDKFRCYFLEMICADFLAGAALETQPRNDSGATATGDHEPIASENSSSEAPHN
jgi:hypothetical protein